MLRKSQIAFAVGMIALILVSNAFGQPGRKRTKAKPTTVNAVQPVPKPYLPGDGHTQVELKAKTTPATAPAFVGGTEDGQSIRRKQPGKTKAREGDPDQPIVVGSAKAKKPTNFIGGGDDGQSIRRKQPRNSQSNQATAGQINTNQTPTVNAVKAKKPDHFIGGGDDGSSIRQKQPRHRQSNQTTSAQIDTNQSAVVNTMKPTKPSHYTGGTDDGQSIRRKQPRKRKSSGG
jgi:hypothetical protein